jgi:hypothetical protein
MAAAFYSFVQSKIGTECKGHIIYDTAARHRAQLQFRHVRHIVSLPD